jgi:uncharacterized protein
VAATPHVWPPAATLHAMPPMLATFLADPRWADDAVPYDELPGFLFAVLNGPELIPPSEWIAEIFGGVEPEYASPDHAQAVLGELMALHDGSVALLSTDPAGLPAGVVFRKPPLANFDDGAPLAAWARGFMNGYGWIEDSWDGVPDDFGSIIAALGFFSSRRFAAEVFKTSTGKLGELAAATLDAFPEAAGEYQRIGRFVAAAVDEPVATPATAVEVARNGPCPCGSGRKFKRCCGAASAAH